MMGNKLRKLREARCWSQAHLADAARVNVRTVQRIESGEPCSFETILSLAGALGVDVSEFDPGTRRGILAGRPHLQLAAAALCLGPGAIFVAVNLMRQLGFTSPYSILASLGSALMTFNTFNRISPPIFVGGAAMSVLLCGSLAIRLRVRAEQTALTITGVELRRLPLAFAIAVIGAATTGALVVYCALENFPIRHS
jgi:DNA-binding XRE family transcriptional regulator